MDRPRGRSRCAFAGPKSLPVAYLLWALVGFLGAHRLYLRNVGWGLVYLCTGGLFTIGWFIDALTLPSQVDRANQPWNDGDAPPIAPARLVSEKRFPVGAVGKPSSVPASVSLHRR